MNKILINKIVCGTSMGLYLITSLAYRGMRRQRNEYFAKLEEVTNDYTKLVCEYREATFVVGMQELQIEMQTGIIGVLESEAEIKESPKSKKKKA